MGKISREGKKYYFEKIKEYKDAIEEMMRREKNLLTVISKDENGAEYKKLLLSDEVVNRISYYILMNNLSITILGVKNDSFLNDARKDSYKSIIYLEEVVTGYVDVPFSEYEEQLSKIDGFEDERRYALIRKLGYSLKTLQDSYGENSKWKWSFVELEARFATVTKNFINLKTVIAGMDPRVPGYEVRLAHLNLAKQLLQQSADRYRQKYELSTLRIDDFKLAINYLSALRRLHILLGESENSEKIKRKIDVWKTKMDDDEQRGGKKGTA